MTRGPRGSRGPAILFIAMTFAELSASLPLNGGIAPHARIARWLPCLSFSMADLYRHLARALLDEIHTAGDRQIDDFGVSQAPFPSFLIISGSSREIWARATQS